MCIICANEFDTNAHLVDPNRDMTEWVEEFMFNLEYIKFMDLYSTETLQDALPTTLRCVHGYCSLLREKLVGQGVPYTLLGKVVMPFQFGIFLDPSNRALKIVLRVFISCIDDEGRSIIPENVRIEWDDTYVALDIIMMCAREHLIQKDENVANMDLSDE